MDNNRKKFTILQKLSASARALLARDNLTITNLDKMSEEDLSALLQRNDEKNLVKNSSTVRNKEIEGVDANFILKAFKDQFLDISQRGENLFFKRRTSHPYFQELSIEVSIVQDLQIGRFFAEISDEDGKVLKSVPLSDYTIENDGNYLLIDFESEPSFDKTLVSESATSSYQDDSTSDLLNERDLRITDKKSEEMMRLQQNQSEFVDDEIKRPNFRSEPFVLRESTNSKDINLKSKDANRCPVCYLTFRDSMSLSIRNLHISEHIPL